MTTKSALLLIDIQNDYFEGGSNPLTGSLEAGLNAHKLLQYYRQRNLPVFHVQHLSTRPGSTFFLLGTDGAKIHELVEPQDNEKVIVKHSPNSFFQTNLEALFKADAITELVVCGMMTHMCIDATVRAAKDLGYHCTVIGDACATKNLEFNGIQVEAREVQTAFLAALHPYYAVLTQTDQYLSLTMSLTTSTNRSGSSKLGE